MLRKIIYISEAAFSISLNQEIKNRYETDLLKKKKKKAILFLESLESSHINFDLIVNSVPWNLGFHCVYVHLG